MGSKRKRGAKEGANAIPNPQKRTKNDKSAKATPAQKPKITLDKSPFVETPLGDERKREAGLYELLGSEDATERIEAADCIVSSLLGEESVTEPVLQRHLDRRLFRGLASGRNASRLGFSLVITELLGQLFGRAALAETKYTGLTFEKTLEILAEKTQAIGNIPGQEERDHWFGQLFGIECFVRAGIPFSDASRWNAVLDLLLRLANKKVWLRSQCGWVIVQSIEQMSQKDAKATLERVADAGLAKTPEGAAIWLVALNRFPSIKVKPWENPLSKKCFGDLAAVLRESFTQDQGDQGQKNKQASWTAQLHFAWDLILAHYVKEADAGSAEFEQFWSRVVDDGLFSKSATDGQKFKGFSVFQKMLEGLVDHPSHIECLFSKNLTTCLMNQAAKEDRYLHRAATKALKAVEAVVSAHPDTLVPILRSLLGTHGAYNFDQRTSTKTVEKILQKITEDTAPETLKIVRQPIGSLAKLEDAQAVSTLRVYADYLSRVLNASASSSSGEMKQKAFASALQELSQLAYSRPDHIPETALTEPVQELCRSRLESAFAKLSRKTEDYESLCVAVSSIDPDSVAMSEEIKTAVQDALARMQKLLKRKSKAANEKSLSQGLAMLHAVSIFQLYNQDPDAMEVLNDLAQYSDRLKKGKSAESEPGTSELLVEILLSMVSRPSSLMRQVSQQVFDAFTPQISAEGLELLTGPLGSDESTKGQKELFNTEDDMEIDEDDESDNGEDGSDIEIDSDVEFIDLKEQNGDGSGEEDEEDEDDDEDQDADDDDNDDDDEETEDAEGQEPQDLEAFMSKIFKSHRLDKDAEAESSDSDADMSDSEMFAHDSKLEAFIKNQKEAKGASKKQKKDAKQSVVNFKNRILDLLDIYIRNEALKPLTFSLLLPVLNLMRTTTTKPLAARACEIILNYQKALKKARNTRQDAEAPPVDDLLGLLLNIHAEAAKDNAHAYAKASSAASLVVASAMYAEDKSKIKDVAAVYAKSQSDWVLGEAKLQSSFFADWNNWCQNLASQAHS
ncbi:DNA polymerase phi-domain-containing protein [Ilyonectria robusta]|uniref:DNA polymerase phi-domain-containing protein n=1 Tax=Ilyonectria robusta TaxID=1079257 RepID=UPI001E8EC61A|nr:DNA polymerase phi-domain-containing protein [Ilyonectria robusta]KAH8737182.1 DNA polymerase phi-domain-containing protein [Ilyonectria robusta]